MPRLVLWYLCATGCHRAARKCVASLSYMLLLARACSRKSMRSDRNNAVRSPPKPSLGSFLHLHPAVHPHSISAQRIQTDTPTQHPLCHCNGVKRGRQARRSRKVRQRRLQGSLPKAARCSSRSNSSSKTLTAYVPLLSMREKCVRACVFLHASVMQWLFLVAVFG